MNKDTIFRGLTSLLLASYEHNHRIREMGKVGCGLRAPEREGRFLDFSALEFHARYHALFILGVTVKDNEFWDKCEDVLIRAGGRSLESRQTGSAQERIYNALELIVRDVEARKQAIATRSN